MNEAPFTTFESIITDRSHQSPHSNAFSSYEDSTHMFSSQEQVNASRTHFWNRVYQARPQDPSQTIFKCREPETSSKPTSAQAAWGKFNPEKQPNYEFDVFKMFKNPKETTNHSSIDIEHSQKQQLPLHPTLKEAVLIQPKKPPPFMGAFSHVQPEYNFFNLSISIPTAQQYKPFSCFYREESQQAGEEHHFEASHLNVSKISAIQDIKKQPSNRYFFEVDSAESEISEIVDQKDLKEPQHPLRPQQKLEQQGEKSLLWNYSVLFEQRADFKHRDPMWQQPSMEREGRQSRVFEVNREWSLQVLHEMEVELNLAEEMKEAIPDEYILSEISKIMQNVECELFSLDYHRMEWSMDLGRFRLEHSFKSSLRHRIKEILLIANYRSRIDVALQYIRKRPFRRVYYQLGVQITEIQILFEEIVLSEAKGCSLVEFFSRVEKLKLEMTLLYKLLINQSYVADEGRSYQDFDYRYLNSEYVIFKQIVKQARVADSLNTELKPMITTLLCAVFKPITTILNGILFEQCAVIQLNQEIYLKYFFDNHKDIVEFVSRKIALIKGESHELYQVCRMRDTIEIFNDLQELERYEHRWDRIFARKRKLIERIRKNYKLKVRSERERKHEQRMRFIYSLKSRIYQQNEQENARKRQVNQRNKEELERLKKEIDARQERRKLMEQIEKEKEKGLIFDILLQEKQRMQKERQTLLKQINQINGQNIEQKADNAQRKEEKPQLNRQTANSIQQQLLPPTTILQNKTSIKQQEIKQAEPISQQHIKSANSIQSHKMVFTADNFLLKKDRNSSKISNNTDSYFRLAGKQRPSFEVDSPPSSDYSMQVQQLSQGEQEFQPLSVQLSINRELDLSTSLQVCFSDIIKKQLQVIQSSLSFLVIDKYEILSLLNFMRNVLMSGNGQRVQEFVNVAINQNSMLNLKYFSECLLFDTSLESIQKLEPYFYHSKKETKYNTEINIFSENIEDYIGFQFRKLPVILEPYFAYTHISRYMQIFGFILRLKYCQKLISKSWKLLNNYKKDLQAQEKQGGDVERWLCLLKKLYNIRYIINNFLITFENYMFLKIVEKQFKILKQNISNLHELQANHLKMLDNIIRFTFIDNPNQNVSKNLRRNLTLIHQFYQIIYQLTLDDIPVSQLKQIHEKTTKMQVHFKREQSWMQNVIQKVV